MFINISEVKKVKERFSNLSPSARKGIFSGGALILLFIVFSIANPLFITNNNIINIFQQVVTYSILGYGLTFCLVAGGTDLSAGASMALSGIMVTSMLISGVPLVVAIVLAILFGVAMGILNGFIIEVLHVVPFIATLGTQWVFRGLGNVIVDGKPIYTNVIPNEGVQKAFYQIGGGRLPNGLPYSVIIALVYGIVLAVVLAKTRIGRQIYAVGSNVEAAKLSGINTVKTRMFAYSISGVSAAIAGIITTSRISSAQPMAGQGLELEAIAASVIGGVSNAGGQGTIVNTIIGALIMGVLRNGLNLMGVSSFVQQIIVGIILVGVIALDEYNHRKQAK